MRSARGQADRLRHQFPKHHVNRAQACERHRQRYCMNNDQAAHAPLRRHKALNQARERHLSQRTNRQARQRDAYLHPRYHSMQVSQQLFHDLGLRIPFRYQLAYPRQPHRHQ